VVIFFLIIISFFLSIVSFFLIKNAEKEDLLQLKDLKLLLQKKFYKSEFLSFFLKSKNQKINFYNICFFSIFFIIILLFLLFLIFSNNFILTKKIIFEFLVFFILFLSTIIDIKYKIFPNFLFYFFLFLCLCNALDSLFFIKFFSGIGVFFISFIVYYLGIFIFKEEALGFGDVKIFTCLGLFFGFKLFLSIFFYSFFVSAIFCIFFKFLNKLRIIRFDISKFYIPFIPFIFISLILNIYFKKYIVFFT
jgi:prepilin signal peptidase PulO-like enzyme (type II secretory pathway)